MKLPKKPSQEPSLPSQDEARRANVLREEMLSQFRVLGEGFSLLRDDVHAMKPQLAKLDGDMEILKTIVRSHSVTLAEIKAEVKDHTHRLGVVEAKPAC